MRTLQEIKESFQQAPARVAKLVADERARQVQALDAAKARLPGAKDNQIKTTQGEIARLEARIAEIDAAKKGREDRAKAVQAVKAAQAVKAEEKIAEIRATQEGYAKAVEKHRAEAEAKAAEIRAKLDPKTSKAPEPVVEPPPPVDPVVG